MSEKRKKWNTLTDAYRTKVVAELVNSSAPHCHEPSDFVQLLKHFLQRVAREHPHLADVCSDVQNKQIGTALLQSLGKLRGKHEQAAYHKPVLTINEVDDAVVHAVPDKALLAQHGYPLNKKHYGLILRKEAILRVDKSKKKVNLGGQPSFVKNPDKVRLVQQVLDEHTIDSERVVIIGRGAKRRMVIAKHLTKNKHRLWCEHDTLNQEMSWGTFHKILRFHFPHVRKPHRNTDVCYHCKIFDKEILPDALKSVQGHRANIVEVLQDYFSPFDREAEKRGLSQSQEEVQYIELFYNFLHDRESTSSRDPLRKNLSRADRITLHSLEADALHHLKGHLELVKAYEWHKISARRQADFLKSMREGGLPQSTALLQVDFKENIKYPMGPNETSEEWHAQNKLSLTVFGANVIAPKPLVFTRVCFIASCSVFFLCFVSLPKAWRGPHRDICARGVRDPRPRRTGWLHDGEQRFVPC